MAKPRVFISSTYYDLRYVREDLERFIKGLGYEPIRHEAGAIPYGREAPLEESAYREVAHSDIIICIVGGRYGTESSTREGSITQNELKEALSKRVQVYVFIEASVHAEFATYQLNKDKKDIKYRFVDNPAVYQFIEQIYSLPQNNPVTPFSTSADICAFLQQQWAGLFQRFLQGQPRIAEAQTLEEMKVVASTLQQLVTFLTEERKNRDEAVKSILLSNHPAFRQLAELLDIQYRIFFTTRPELTSWLAARSYKPVREDQYDKGSVAEWINEKAQKYLRLTGSIFDSNNRLKAFTDAEWDKKWFEVKEAPPSQTTAQEASDNVPF